MLGVKVENKIYELTFEAFECTNVREAKRNDLRDMDFWLEQPYEQWKDMIENIKKNGAADLTHTLNTIDLSMPGRVRAVERRLPARRVLPLQPVDPGLLQRFVQDRHAVRGERGGDHRLTAEPTTDDRYKSRDRVAALVCAPKRRDCRRRASGV